MSDYKTCTRCGETKLPEMYRWMASKGMHYAQCLTCERAAGVERWRAKHGEPTKAAIVRWTDAEDAVIIEMYPKGGAAAVHEAIPSRTRKAIVRRAGQLGVSNARSRGEADTRIDRGVGWAVPQHDYTPADFAVRGWRTTRPVGAVFAPSLGIAA